MTASKAVDAVRLGAIEIVLPTAGEPNCYIFHDLAGLFGDDFNSEALDRFKAEWKKRGKRGRLDLDCEADAVSIYGGREAVLEAAILICDLAIPSVARPSRAEIESARAVIKRFKRPARVQWQVGDVFAAPLVDGSFAIGQVLWEMTFAKGFQGRSPTVALFEHRSTSLTAVDLDDALTARTLAILHVQSDGLDTGRWRVLGRRPVVDDPRSGPCTSRDGLRTSWDGLQILANAWYGLTPWNAFYKDGYLDDFLMPGVKRPAKVMLK
jgi:hypothetical protein